MTRMAQVARMIAGVLLLGRAAAADAFEGTLNQFSLVVPTAALKPFLGDKGEATPEAVFAVPDASLLPLLNDPSSGARRLNAVIRVKGNRFRVDMLINDQPGYMLVDSAKDTTSLVVPGQKQYVQWTRADREAVAAEIEQRQRALRAEIEQAPPEQRAQLAARLEPTPGPTPAVRKLDRAGMINGLKATLYEVKTPTETSMGWVADAHPELVDALRAAAKSQQGPRPRPRTPMEALSDHGLPVRVQTLGQRQYDIIDVAEVKEEKIADELFVIPSDFTRVAVRTPAATAAPAATPAPH